MLTNTKLPVLITRGLIVFPTTSKDIEVGREISINAVNWASGENNELLIVSQINPNIERPSTDELFKCGTLCTITNKKEANDGGYTITVKGNKRVNLTDIKLEKKENSYSASYSVIKETNANNSANEEKMKLIMENYENISAINNDKKKMLFKELFSGKMNGAKISDGIGNILTISLDEMQTLLEEKDITKRLDKIILFLIPNHEKEKIDGDITKKINETLSKQQKEFYLREKMKVVKEELGRINENENELSSIKNKIETKPYPEYIKNKVKDELKRIEGHGSHMQEAAITKSYLDWIISLPYWQETKDNNDIKNVVKVLNETHFGLEKVKERIVEYLAIKTRNQNSKSPILCLVGAPGVGKTTLAHSIAVALGKKFVKMSLGGVHDESEIRGHRKTYLGAMPGRVIKAMKQAEVINPLFLLDEIDKITNDGNHGDPSSALLEVLDPEQNKDFVDNFIEEKYDLSKVMFIATANYLDKIPDALQDRLEIIEVNSYTEREKLAIAKNYLIKKSLDEALLEKEVEFTEEALLDIIRHYTREAGVRELGRLIQTIVRKFIVRMGKDEIKKEKIDIEQVRNYLKKPLYEYTLKDSESIPGVVNGMAYTSAGGDLLPIEVTTFAGKGNATITGNLKDTMKESVQVALGYVKANAKKFGIEGFEFDKNDLHVHVPSGGIPKDGPSAGVTLTTAIISCLKNKKVPNNIAMTGEITLRGKVGIIGGVREKVISAYRGGVNEIFLPKSDEKYIEDVPKEVSDNITFHLVDNYDDIYNILFV